MTRLSESVKIRRWTQADIEYVADSVNREAWGHTKLDVERCWKLEPNGCFIAEFHSEPIGHVFSVCYGRIGWIGLLIVNPESRGQGVGSLLTQTAINHLQRRGAETIRLDGAEKAVPLYKRLGFVEEFDSLRFRGQLLDMVKPRHKPRTTSRMREDEVGKVAEFDALRFGTNRLPVLQSLYRDFSQYCLVAKHKQHIVGYVIARQTQRGFWVGPWVCLNSETAQDLFSGLVEVINREDAELRVGMPALNTRGQKLMEKLRFQLISKSIHMVLGNTKNQGRATYIYGIGGPEKG